MKTLSSQLASSVQKPQSITCLTGNDTRADMYQNFDDFKKHNRLNPFTVEEYYFLRNNQPSVPEEKKPRRTMKNMDSMASMGD